MQSNAMGRPLAMQPQRRANTSRSWCRRLSGHAAATVSPPATRPATGWDAIADQAGTDVLEHFYLRGTDAVPATSPTKPLHPSPNPKSDQPVIFFRDTNGWCPHCQKVWMALLEKGVGFDTVLIDLGNKPEWYRAEVVESGLTPAVTLQSNGQTKTMDESHDIMMELEKWFPDTKKLVPAGEAGDEMLQFLKLWDSKFRAILSIITAPAEVPDDQKPLLEDTKELLQAMEAAVQKHGGPHLYGALSIADITLAPFVPRLAHTKVQSANLSSWPGVASAMEALQALPSYKETAIDSHTWQAIVKSYFGAGQPQADMSKLPKEEMTARRKAAAKIARNRQLIVDRLCSHSGVVRRQGSEFGETVENVNGYSMNPRENSVRAEVEAALLRVCDCLLTKSPGLSPVSKEGTAIQVAALAYFRNLAAAPRDMSAAAVAQLRQACDEVIQAAFVFPEKRPAPAA